MRLPQLELLRFMRLGLVDCRIIFFELAGMKILAALQPCQPAAAALLHALRLIPEHNTAFRLASVQLRH